MSPPLVITCEHGGNRVPARLAHLFEGRQNLLASHAAYDPGALEVARALASATGAPLLFSTVSRLVVDLNRSPGHRDLFSPPMKALTAEERATIARDIHTAYRERVMETVRASQKAHPGQATLHLAIHSFTPELRGEVRRADVGLLYDPRRAGEVAWANRLRGAFAAEAGALVVRRNYPYRGRSDGIMTSLRATFGHGYAGVEVEINHGPYFHGGGAWRARKALVVASLVRAASG